MTQSGAPTTPPTVATPTPTATGPTVARTVQVTRPGGPDVLAVRDVRLAPPGQEEVLVKVDAAGVSFSDLQLREGLRRVALPAVPGMDVAGSVMAKGPGVPGLEVGDRVAVWTQGTGGYATHLLAPAWTAVRVPAQLDQRQVAALVLNYLTAWQLLHRTGPALEPGSTVLVHSAAGGVGTALLQLAALRGLRVLGTASAAKAPVVRRLGAVPIDYRSTDVDREVRRLAPDGLDAVFDGLGSATWRRATSLLRPGGHLVVYGMSTAFSGGRRSIPRLLQNLVRLPRPNYLRYVSRNVGVTGYSSDSMITARRDWYRQDLGHLIELLEHREISPVLSGDYRLEDAAKAQTDLGAGRATGKIVLDVTP